MLPQTGFCYARRLLELRLECFTVGVAGDRESPTQGAHLGDGNTGAVGDDRICHQAEKRLDATFPVLNQMLKLVVDADLLEGLRDVAVVHDRRTVDPGIPQQKLVRRQGFLALQSSKCLDIAEEGNLDAGNAARAHQLRVETRATPGATGCEIVGILGEPLNDFGRSQLPPAIGADRPGFVVLVVQDGNEPQAQREGDGCQKLALFQGQLLFLAKRLVHSHAHHLEVSLAFIARAG